MAFEAAPDAIPPIETPARQRRRQETPRADKAHDIPRRRRALSARRFGVRVARKGIDASQRPGRQRWVAERTPARLNRFRRSTVRHERRPDIDQAVLALGCRPIRFNTLQDES